jgi:hypothetical protein
LLEIQDSEVQWDQVDSQDQTERQGLMDYQGDQVSLDQGAREVLQVEQEQQELVDNQVLKDPLAH